MLDLYVASSDGPSGIQVSADGAFGSAIGGNALSDGTRNQMAMPVPVSVPSPISDSNLVFLREQLYGGASDFAIAFARALGVYV